MTEDEAKTKRCCGPFHSGQRTFVNSNVNDTDNPKLCIGSVCMAWRWEEPPAAGRPERQFMDRGVPKYDHGAPGRAGDGYCGLAGKP